MNMILMLGIITFFYFVSLLLLCMFHEKINIRVGNAVFIVLDIVTFFCWNLAAYQIGWLENGFMTLGNISPLVCTLIPLTLFMGEKTKNYCYSALSFLWLGLFFAMLISPEHAYLFNFNDEANFLYASEALCHMVCSLFGIYLILTGQVKTDFRHWLQSLIFLFSIITFAVILNHLFHKNFFGMDPYGNYSIYMIDIFATFEATLVAYYLGVLLVLTIGWQVGALFHRFVQRTKRTVLEPIAKEED